MSPHGTRGARRQQQRANNANNDAGREATQTANTNTNAFSPLEEEDRIDEEVEGGGEDEDGNGTEGNVTPVTASITQIKTQLTSWLS